MRVAARFTEIKVAWDPANPALGHGRPPSATCRFTPSADGRRCLRGLNASGDRGGRAVAIRGILFDKDGTIIDYWRTWVPINREAALYAAARR